MNKINQAKARILKLMDMLDKSGENRKIYEELFKKMSSKEFDSFMHKLKGGVILPVFSANGKNKGFSVENNLKVADKLGVKIHEKVIFVNEDGTERLSNFDYMVVPLQVRRTIQTHKKSVNIPKDTKTKDHLTGQVTGKSSANKFTYQEANVLKFLGMGKAVKELYTTRGGDLGLERAAEVHIVKNGRLNRNEIEQYSTSRESTKSLSTIFKAAHLTMKK